MRRPASSVTSRVAEVEGFWLFGLRQDAVNASTKVAATSNQRGRSNRVSAADDHNSPALSVPGLSRTIFLRSG